VQAPARGPAASSWRGIRARRLPHPEFVVAAHAGVGTDMVPDGLLPRSHCCSLARCHRRFLRHRQTRGSRGCCYYTGSASSPSPPQPCWCHASPLSGPSTLQTCAPPTFSRRLKTMMGTVRGELIDMGERDKPRRLTRRHRGRWLTRGGLFAKYVTSRRGVLTTCTCIGPGGWVSAPSGYRWVGTQTLFKLRFFGSSTVLPPIHFQKIWRLGPKAYRHTCDTRIYIKNNFSIQESIYKTRRNA
jgi:hypothetical protein